MKKFLMAAVALICMTMTSVVLTSCGSDDDDSKQSQDITCEYGILTQIPYYTSTSRVDEADPWNTIVKDTDKKVMEILAKYSTTWKVKATTSTVEQVLAENDAEAKQKVAAMKAELNKVFEDLQSLKSTYPEEYIRYTIYVVATQSGYNKNRNFVNEDITLHFGKTE